MRHTILAAIATVTTLTGCGGGEVTKPTPTQYDISVTNVTAGQALSPPVALLHDPAFSAWRIGSAASLGLERLAEGGASADFVAELPMVYAVHSASKSLLPGQRLQMTLSADAHHSPALTLAAMLVQTNDGFTGVTAWSLAQLAPGESVTKLMPVYDAGTEMNSETQNSVPGVGGEGFNPERDDIGALAMHPGTVTASDGLPTSALDANHRFGQGALQVTVTRSY